MAFVINDVDRKDIVDKSFEPEKHINFLLSLDTKKEDYLNAMSEYLKMSGVYWALNSLVLLDYSNIHSMKNDIIKFIKSCEHPSGGYTPNKGHNPHLLYTLSVIQICLLLDAIEVLDKDKIVCYIKSLYNLNGSFCGEEWGEVDTRFTFCAITSLALIDRLPDISLELNEIINFTMKCHNFDEGFGTKPGSESHAGQIYCCLGVLAITGNLHLINADKLGWWLSERQLPSGGLNGRPEKMPDVCYSWWVLASMAIIGRLNWINKTKLESFILACQDEETGGFTDRPNDMPDPFHTVFGLSGLSILKTFPDQILEVNPIFCLPQEKLPDYVKYQIL